MLFRSYECRQVVKIPIIGMGGISNARDALEFIIAGATAVQIGTANFVTPLMWEDVIAGIDGYLDRHRIPSVNALIGALETPGQRS